VSNDFHVSPAGNDDAAGTPGDPFRTPHRAAEALAAVGGGTAWFAPGRYELASTWKIGPAGSGRRVFRADDPGTAILSGGRVITDWRVGEVHGRRAWVADLPDVRSGHWNFRQLFVGGRRALRARYPKFGVDVASRGNLLKMEEIRVIDATNKMSGGDFQFRPRPGDLEAWPSFYDAEIVVPHFWLEERMGQLRMRPDGWVESARRSIFALTAAFGPEPASYYVDNLFEALTDAGEWYLDRHAGRLYYLPLEGEEPGETEVIAPALRSLLEIRGDGYNETKQFGDPCMDRPAADLEFVGLVFEHADWIQPVPLFSAHDKMPPPERPLAACGQSACDAPSAISLVLARGIEFRDCGVRHVGGYGIAIEQGCRSVEVAGCEFSDLGAGGVRINGAERDGAPWRVTGYCSVTDNRIEAGGRVFHAGVGILAMNTLENVIAHNFIRDLFYSGISVGWSWGYKDTVSRDNLVLQNIVEDVGQGLLSDLGAIYVLGVQPGTVVAGNRVGGVLKRHYGSIGIYLDEGASHVVVEGNLVHDTQGACANIHFGRENLIRHNTFLVAPGGVGVTIGKTEAHIAASLFGNLTVVPAGAAAYGGGYKGDPARSFLAIANHIRTPDASPPAVWNDGHGERLSDWETWISSGQDPASDLEVDPGGGASPQSRAASLAAGLSPRLLAWMEAGPRPADNRPPLRQPLTREDRPAA